MASDMNEAIFNSKQSLPNKLLQEDGTVTDIAGNLVTESVDAYTNKAALPNKFLNPDGTYSSLNEILASIIDTELFVVVSELPASGASNKIYLLVDGDKLIEYVWVNNKWDPIGMVEFDVSQYSTTEQMNEAIEDALDEAKEYADNLFNNIQVDPQIFYYDGVKTNYAFWNDLIKITTPVLIYMFQEDNKAFYSAYIVNPSAIASSSANRNITFTSMADTTQEFGGYTGYFQQIWRYNLTFTNGQVTSIYTSYEKMQISAIDPTKNYGGAFSPTQPWHPATKKYVDDSIATNITNALGGSY